MSKFKYAMQNADGMLIRDWDPDGKFRVTSDLDRAMLYTPMGIEEHLPFFEEHGITLIPVEVKRIMVDSPRSASEFLDEILEKLRAEFEKLDHYDIDTLSEHDFRRWKRLKRQLKNREIDKSPI